MANKHNSDNRRIGVCDSGLGGLTSLPSLQQLLPNESVLYFGDTARTPYGSRDRTTVKRFGAEIIDFLAQNGAKLVVIACNTLAATILPEISEKYPELPIVGVIEPMVKALPSLISKGDRLGIIGTQVTIESGIYSQKIAQILPDIATVSLACPLFVPMIEDGSVSRSEMRQIVRLTLDDFLKGNQVTHLLLGCTHFPLLDDIISELYPNLTLLDPAHYVSYEVKRILEAKAMLATEPKISSDLYYASDLSPRFCQMVDKLAQASRNKFKELRL